MEEARNDVAAVANGPAPAQSPVRWYSRAALDRFLDEAATERARLNETIADANARLVRANAAIGLHQMMMEMLLETQRDVRDIRRRAEASAAEIMAAGDRDVADVFGPAGPAGSNSGSSSAHAVPSGNGASAPEPAPRAAMFEDLEPAPEPPVGSGRDDQKFFDYLRSALSDDEPLGPRP